VLVEVEESLVEVGAPPGHRECSGGRGLPTRAPRATELPSARARRTGRGAEVGDRSAGCQWGLAGLGTLSVDRAVPAGGGIRASRVPFVPTVPCRSPDARVTYVCRLLTTERTIEHVMTGQTTMAQRKIRVLVAKPGL